MITGIGHVAFRVTDLERALDFYCDKLGFREAFRLDREGEPSPWIVYLQIAPGHFIELFPGAREIGPQPGASAGYNHFCLLVDDMDGTLERLASVGIEPERPPYTVREGGSRLCFVRDPDDYRIELIESSPQ